MDAVKIERTSRYIANVITKAVKKGNTDEIEKSYNKTLQKISLRYPKLTPDITQLAEITISDIHFLHESGVPTDRIIPNIKSLIAKGVHQPQPENIRDRATIHRELIASRIRSNLEILAI